MADYTSNFRLKLPEASEYFNIDDFNSNFKKIESLSTLDNDGRCMVGHLQDADDFSNGSHHVQVFQERIFGVRLLLANHTDELVVLLSISDQTR